MKWTLNLRGCSRQFGVKTINYVQSARNAEHDHHRRDAHIVSDLHADQQSFAGSSNLLTMTKSFVPYAILGLGVTFVIATGGIDLSIGTSCIASAVMAGAICENVDYRQRSALADHSADADLRAGVRADQRLSGGEVQTSAVYRNAGDHAVFPRDFRDNRGEHHRSLFCDQVPGVPAGSSRSLRI